MADAPLYTSTRERRRQTDLADFYALLKASEAVEKAYARGAVAAADDEPPTRRPRGRLRRLPRLRRLRRRLAAAPAAAA